SGTSASRAKAMIDAEFPSPDPEAFNRWIQAQGSALRAKDLPPATRREWDQRRPKLRQSILDAMGPFPEKSWDLNPQFQGLLERASYRIERLIFQSRPDVWVTANAYVPTMRKERLPAVLVVHGHWAMARRDPVVQARCLGLVKLGFFVLAIDAFGSGE